MATVVPIRRKPEHSLDVRAEAIHNLSYIRNTMENAVSFTAVPGMGSIVMGSTAMLAALAAHWSKSATAWLLVWCAEAFLALAIALLFSYRKAVGNGTVLLSRPFRRFALAMVPSVFAGSVLTVVVYRLGSYALLPGVWLLLYGSGVASAGAFSVRVVRIMGVSFLALGSVAILTPVHWADALMALGFGGLHILYGFIIARNYGG